MGWDATLDRFAGGRVTLGVGLGGVADEFARFGDDPSTRVRAGKLDEGLEIMSRLWSGESVSFDGHHYQVDGVCNPLVPVQRPRVPVWVGGNSPAALRRAARWDGWTMSLFADASGRIGTTADMIAATIATIREHRTAATAFDVVVGAYSDPTPAGARLVGEYADAGATWWLEELNGFRGSLDEMLERVAAGPPR